jgi:lysophospholipase L1-like esterase
MMKKWLVFIGLLLVYRQLSAQTLPLVKPVPDLPFAHLERNQIIYPGDSLAMERFFQKMDSVVFFGEGNLSIMHLGGSHVQAGMFTQQFRDNLLNISTDLIGGQYFVFPFSTGGTNNPSHYIVRSTGTWTYCRNAVRKETDKRMGLAGAAITTNDSTATVRILTKERYPSDTPPDYDFNKMTVIGFSETENVVPVVRFKDTILQGQYDEWKSTYTFSLPDFTDSICIMFDSVPGEFTLTGILLENNMPGISVHGVGVNGARVSSYLRCDDFERDLNLIRPDLIIFGIGINDAAEKDFEKNNFKRNYNELIKVIKRVNPDCALLFITNNDSYKREKVKKKTRYEVNLNGEIVEEAFMELGKKYNAAVWNQFDIMGGLESMQDWEEAGLAKKDKVHFTNEGYRLLGDLLYNALITRYIEHIQQNAKR